MATQTSYLHDWLCAIGDSLAERPGLQGVLVTTGFTEDVDGRDSLQFTDCDARQDWENIGAYRRNEQFEAAGMIITHRPGKGEQVIRATRAAAFAILAELEDELRHNRNLAGVDLAEIQNYRVDAGANTRGRWCQVVFSLGGRRSLRSS